MEVKIRKQADDLATHIEQRFKTEDSTDKTLI